MLIYNVLYLNIVNDIGTLKYIENRGLLSTTLLGNFSLILAVNNLIIVHLTTLYFVF